MYYHSGNGNVYRVRFAADETDSNLKDYYGKIIQSTMPSERTETYTYKYDANGIRTQKNDRQYIIDINNNVVAETDSTGAITDEILCGHRALARKINGKLVLLHL